MPSKDMKRFSLVSSVAATGGAERVGILELNPLNICISTPCLWVATRCFAVPNLTPETWQTRLDSSLFAGLLTPFQHLANRIPVMEAYGAGAASYMGYGGMPTLVAPNDPLTATPSGYNSRKSIALWDNGDKVPITSGSYEKGIKAMRPDAYVALCDGDTPKDTSNKRLSKAVSQTVELLDDCLTNYTLSSHPFLFASVQGGYDLKARRACAKQVAQRTGVDGYFLDGFHHNFTDSNREGILEDMKPILSEVLSILPSDKARLYLGFCTPRMVMDLVMEGVDMFDTSMATYLSENGQAFVFPNQLPESEHWSQLESHWIDLRLDEYKNDFAPLASKCSCYTCQKHSRAYINHLLATKELLAPILLTIHNLHYYGTFFQTIRKLVSLSKLKLLHNVIVQTENKSR